MHEFCTTEAGEWRLYSSSSCSVPCLCLSWSETRGRCELVSVGQVDSSASQLLRQGRAPLVTCGHLLGEERALLEYVLPGLVFFFTVAQSRCCDARPFGYCSIAQIVNFISCAGPVMTRQLRRSSDVREGILKYCHPLQCPT